jgi:hypothetical protein
VYLCAVLMRPVQASISSNGNGSGIAVKTLTGPCWPSSIRGLIIKGTVRGLVRVDILRQETWEGQRPPDVVTMVVEASLFASRIGAAQGRDADGAICLSAVGPLVKVVHCPCARRRLQSWLIGTGLLLTAS